MPADTPPTPLESHLPKAPMPTGEKSAPISIVDVVPPPAAGKTSSDSSPLAPGPTKADSAPAVIDQAGRTFTIPPIKDVLQHAVTLVPAAQSALGDALAKSEHEHGHDSPAVIRPSDHRGYPYPTLSFDHTTETSARPDLTNATAAKGSSNEPRLGDNILYQGKIDAQVGAVLPGGRPLLVSGDGHAIVYGGDPIQISGGVNPQEYQTVDVQGVGVRYVDKNGGVYKLREDAKSEDRAYPLISFTAAGDQSGLKTVGDQIPGKSLWRDETMVAPMHQLNQSDKIGVSRAGKVWMEGKCVGTVDDMLPKALHTLQDRLTSEAPSFSQPKSGEQDSLASIRFRNNCSEYFKLRGIAEDLHNPAKRAAAIASLSKGQTKDVLGNAGEKADSAVHEDRSAAQTVKINFREMSTDDLKTQLEAHLKQFGESLTEQHRSPPDTLHDIQLADRAYFMQAQMLKDLRSGNVEAAMKNIGWLTTPEYMDREPWMRFRPSDENRYDRASEPIEAATFKPVHADPKAGAESAALATEKRSEGAQELTSTEKADRTKLADTLSPTLKGMEKLALSPEQRELLSDAISKIEPLTSEHQRPGSAADLRSSASKTLASVAKMVDGLANSNAFAGTDIHNAPEIARNLHTLVDTYSEGMRQFRATADSIEKARGGQPRTLDDIRALAIAAHDDQTYGSKKYGVTRPYKDHLSAVEHSAELYAKAMGLDPNKPQDSKRIDELKMAACLHDAFEDTALTEAMALKAGVPQRVLEIDKRITDDVVDEKTGGVKDRDKAKDAVYRKIVDKKDLAGVDDATLVEDATALKLADRTENFVASLQGSVNPDLTQAQREKNLAKLRMYVEEHDGFDEGVRQQQRDNPHLVAAWHDMSDLAAIAHTQVAILDAFKKGDYPKHEMDEYHHLVEASKAYPTLSGVQRAATSLDTLDANSSRLYANSPELAHFHETDFTLPNGEKAWISDRTDDTSVYTRSEFKPPDPIIRESLFKPVTGGKEVRFNINEKPGLSHFKEVTVDGKKLWFNDFDEKPIKTLYTREEQQHTEPGPTAVITFENKPQFSKTDANAVVPSSANGSEQETADGAAEKRTKASLEAAEKPAHDSAVNVSARKVEIAEAKAIQESVKSLVPELEKAFQSGDKAEVTLARLWQAAHDQLEADQEGAGAGLHFEIGNETKVTRDTSDPSKLTFTFTKKDLEDANGRQKIVHDVASNVVPLTMQRQRPEMMAEIESAVTAAVAEKSAAGPINEHAGTAGLYASAEPRELLVARANTLMESWKPYDISEHGIEKSGDVEKNSEHEKTILDGISEKWGKELAEDRKHLDDIKARGSLTPAEKAQEEQLLREEAVVQALKAGPGADGSRRAEYAKAKREAHAIAEEGQREAANEYAAEKEGGPRLADRVSRARNIFVYLGVVAKSLL